MSRTAIQGSDRCLGYRGRQVLGYIQAVAEQNGRPPSYTMIADDLGMSSVSDVCNVVRRLEKRGLLSRTDTGSRHRQGWHMPVLVVEFGE